MIADERLIMVIDGAEHRGAQLKELIEFMDTPRVCTAAPGEWRQKLGDHRLVALFVGPDMTNGDVRSLLGEIGELDPNVPIVVMQEGEPG